jgi:hypothetical protein
MKFSLLLLCFVSSILYINAQFLPGVPAAPVVPPVAAPIVPPVAPIAPFGLPFGPLFNPLLNPFLFRPFGFGFGGLLPFRRFRPIVGKREVVDRNATICTLVTQKSTLMCRGVELDLTCPVRPIHITRELGNSTFRLENLSIVPEEISGIRVFRILSRKDDVVQRWTVTSPVTSKDVLLSFYFSEKIDEPGFIVTDEKCWERFESIFVRDRSVRLSLVI